MDTVYSEAVGVLVYLGEHTAGSQMLFEELAETERLLKESQVEKLRIDQRPRPSKTIIRELELLLERPWFRRVWVLQEVYVNRSVTFQCGPHTASYIALFSLYNNNNNNNNVVQDPTVLAMRLDLVGRPDLRSPQLHLWLLLYRSKQV
ncbi:hypothetical protein BU23DRAFT_45375 [Bimuria novae-zelandiae CBS 107.79]|uniref:Heterokaryon incompatibility domain-containing protein n=1 Tax=Bimuria novae-zelandiae CBS 107.79 TaxID=1447943 RepID=A0A6A5VGM1_9PLEO|nr:hypothetical protein BU23DRAFT_45375 [Bimuria novae-zelandiae CBS 107.79]